MNAEPARDPVGVARLVAGAFERLGTRYLLGGSLASTTFGEPRTTLDVDFVADLEPGSVGPLLVELEPDFDGNREWIAAETRRRGSFQLVHRATFIRVDVFVPPWTGVHLWKWQQRRRVVLDPMHGTAIDVTSPEGIVIQKLAWFRETGGSSERQWRDVLGVLKFQARTIDVAAMRAWSRELGLEPWFDAALREAGVPPTRS